METGLIGLIAYVAVLCLIFIGTIVIFYTYASTIDAGLIAFLVIMYLVFIGVSILFYIKFRNHPVSDWGQVWREWLEEEGRQLELEAISNQERQRRRILLQNQYASSLTASI